MEKEKDNVSNLYPSLESNDAAETTLNGAIISSPIMTNAEDYIIVSESEYDVENLMEELKNEENELVVAGKEESAVEEEKNEESAVEEEQNEDIAEEDPIEEENDGDNAKEEMNEKKLEVSSKEKIKKSRKRNRKKVALKDSQREAFGDKRKTESSGEKMASKKAESMGMIFMCSSKTKKDCYRYKVLGLPAGKRDTVEKVYKGMRLFLFDFDMRLLYGIYKAAGRGGYNIEPKAFKSQFPAQVRFTILEDCLPLAEEKFKNVIKDNYYARNKFDCHLTSEQVKKLCKLFVAANKSSKTKKSSRSLRADTRTFVDRDRIRRMDQEDERHSTLVGARQYREHHPVIYEPVVFTSPRAPLPRVLPLPPPAPRPSYAYERALDMDDYRQDPLTEHRDGYRQYPLLEHHDAYRLDPLLERRDLRVLDKEPNHQDEIRIRDPYISYREHPYRAVVYSAPSEYYPPANLPPEHRSLGPLTDYRSSTGQLPQYHSLRSVYRY